MNIRNEREALTVAVEMEKRAIKTYERAKMMLSADEMITAADSILSEEMIHLQRFQQMLDSMPEEGRIDMNITSSLAADALFKGGVLGMYRKEAFTDIRGLYEYAAESEQDAVLFYTDCADQCGDTAVGEAFRSIAREESAHLCALKETLRNL